MSSWRWTRSGHGAGDHAAQGAGWLGDRRFASDGEVADAVVVEVADERPQRQARRIELDVFPHLGRTERLHRRQLRYHDHAGGAEQAGGKIDDAMRSFEAVKGSDGTADLARLWRVYLASPARK